MAEVILNDVLLMDQAKSKTISILSGMGGNGSLRSRLIKRLSGIKSSNTWNGSLVQMAYSLSNTILVAIGVFPADHLVL